MEIIITNQWHEPDQKQIESVGVHHFANLKKKNDVIVEVRLGTQHEKWLFHAVIVGDL